MSAPRKWDADEDEVENMLSQIEDESMVKLKLGGHLYSRPAQGYLPELPPPTSSSHRSPEDTSLLGDDLAQRWATVRAAPERSAAPAPALTGGQEQQPPGQRPSPEDLDSRFAQLKAAFPPPPLQSAPTEDDLEARLARLRGGAAPAAGLQGQPQLGRPGASSDLDSTGGDDDEDDDLFARMQALRGAAPAKRGPAASAPSSSGSRDGAGAQLPRMADLPGGDSETDEDADVGTLLSSVRDEVQLANPRQPAAQSGPRRTSRRPPGGGPDAVDDADVASLLSSVKHEVRTAYRRQREIKSGDDIDERRMQVEADKVVAWALSNADERDEDVGPTTGNTERRQRGTRRQVDSDDSETESGKPSSNTNDDSDDIGTIVRPAKPRRSSLGLLFGKRR